MQIFTETPRLLLREILPEDENGLFELDSDPEVHLYLGKSPVTSLEKIREVIQFIRQQYIDNGIGRWAVIEKETGNFLGWAGLKLMREEMNGKKDFYDLGYRFIRKYWGKGYATEAALASVQYGFEQLGLREIYGIADVENVASRKVLEKCGLQHLGTFEYEGNLHYWMKVEK